MKLPEPTPDSGLCGNGNNSSTVCTRRSLLDLISDMGSTPIISTKPHEVGGLPAAVTRFYCSEMPEKQGLASFYILKSNRYFLLFQIRNTFSRESVCSLQGWRICSRLHWDMCRMRRIRGCSHTLCLRYLPALHWSGTPGEK